MTSHLFHVGHTSINQLSVVLGLATVQEGGKGACPQRLRSVDNRIGSNDFDLAHDRFEFQASFPAEQTASGSATSAYPLSRTRLTLQRFAAMVTGAVAIGTLVFLGMLATRSGADLDSIASSRLSASIWCC